MRILFISRTYPPIIGGIEKQNYDIAKSLSEIADVRILANTKRGIILPFFAIYALFYALSHLKNFDVILLGDGALSILAYFLKLFTTKPVACIVHGLDITYSNQVYQNLWIRKFIKKQDKLIAVGNETIRQGVSRGIPPEKFVFVPNGVFVKENLPHYTKEDLQKTLGIKIEGPLLLSLGRMVRRKGVAWFIENVMRNLADNVFYIIAGDGPEKQNIIDKINKLNLNGRVFCLGNVDDQIKEMLFCTADLFIQSNIKVAGDMEGFGLVVLEAASYGLPVIASNIEGLPDAIVDGKNGILVDEKNADAYKEKIQHLLQDKCMAKEFGRIAREFVSNNFSWEIIARKYYALLQELIKKKT
ncbi:MAG: hypothetical protein AMK70_09740 [Nitrospira bacterium SG8_35_1]|nr:MAG: hypothetical protein AMK70_09740 [Nitrospira bacterium SG8_35_1]